MFGQGKTVIRGGYSRIFGRLNGVDLVLVPLLGTGLIQPVQCIGAQSPTVGIANTPCAGSGLATPANAFRIGTDGMTAPIPTPSATLPQPDFPGVNAIAAGAGEALDQEFPARRIGSVRPHHSAPDQQQDDDRIRLHRSQDNSRISTRQHQRGAYHDDAWRADVRQGLCANLELQYCGGIAGLSGAGCTANAAAVTAQPFFETALAGTGYCTGFANCTQASL